MTEEATIEFKAEIKDLGDKIVALSLLDAQQLSDYLKDTYGIEPAAGGAVMMAAAPGGDGGGAAEEQTAFDVVLTGAGDKKIQVIKLSVPSRVSASRRPRNSSRAPRRPSRKASARKTPRRSRASSKRLGQASRSSSRASNSTHRQPGPRRRDPRGCWAVPSCLCSSVPTRS
mgnify:CR=1 FL=1